MSIALRDGCVRDRFELVQFPIDAADNKPVPEVRISIEESDPSVSADTREGSAEAAPTRREECIAIAKKIAELSICVGFIIGYGLQKSHDSFLIGRAYFAFVGGGWVAPVVMLSTYLALKCIVYVNQKRDPEEEPVLKKTLSWLRKIPEDFVTGVRQFPQMLKLKIKLAVVSGIFITLVGRFKGAPVNTGPGLDVRKLTFLDLAIKGPFLEELFFREMFQGSIVSAMKIVNLVGERLGRGAFIAEETISSVSRVMSATCFGLVHAHQSIIQALFAGVSSLFYETELQEKHGLFASFGVHSANNAFAWVWRLL